MDFVQKYLEEVGLPLPSIEERKEIDGWFQRLGEAWSSTKGPHLGKDPVEKRLRFALELARTDGDTPIVVLSALENEVREIDMRDAFYREFFRKYGTLDPDEQYVAYRRSYTEHFCKEDYLPRQAFRAISREY